MVENRFKHFRVFAISCLLWSAIAAGAPSGTPPPFTLSSSTVANGGVVRISVILPKNANPASLKGRFEQTTLFFFPNFSIEPGLFESFLGIPHSHTPTKSKIELEWTNAEGKNNTEELAFEIIDGGYASESLKVDPRKVSPRKKDLIRIKKEMAEVGALYSKITLEKFWTGPFQLPIDSPMTSPYGTKRMFNGQTQSYHSGLDLKAAVGTPVKSAAPGIVVLAKDLFFSGNTVIIDHGYGFFSLYCHLSAFKVKPGQKVSTGKLLGLSGKSGRVSGPHLHWQVVVQKAKISPLEMTKVMR
ncbi:M23 family metallopeptidase [Bdellovibrionota bacterium FG-2]